MQSIFRSAAGRHSRCPLVKEQFEMFTQLGLQGLLQRMYSQARFCPENPLENRGKIEGVAVHGAERPIDDVRFKISDKSISDSTLKISVTRWF